MDVRILGLNLVLGFFALSQSAQALEVSNQVLSGLSFSKGECELHRTDIGENIKQKLELDEVLTSCVPYAEKDSWGIVLFSNKKIPALSASMSGINTFTETYQVSVPYTEMVTISFFKDNQIECCKSVPRSRSRIEARSRHVKIENLKQCELYVGEKNKASSKLSHNAGNFSFCISLPGNNDLLPSARAITIKPFFPKGSITGGGPMPEDM
jgi:hypothetical protein